MRAFKIIPMILLLASTPCVGAASTDPVHAVDHSEMQAAIATRVGEQASQRAAIQRLLARPEVRQLAAGSGLDLARAKAAAAHLEGTDLERLAAQATAADAQLAGGGTTVVLSTTALLVILLIVILVAG